MTNVVSEIDSSPPKKSTRGKRLWLIIATVLVVIALIATVTLFVWPGFLSSNGSQDNAPANSAAASSPSADFTEFRNDQIGIALSYPSSWAQLRSPDPQVLLVASEGPLGTVQMRALDLPTPVGQAELPAAKQLTDQIVGANTTAKMIVEPKQVQPGGLPGYWYLYTFTDQDGQEGAHSHFFIFKDKTMISLVFETLPAENFKDSAPEFDKIIDSFHVIQK